MILVINHHDDHRSIIMSIINNHNDHDDHNLDRVDENNDHLHQQVCSQENVELVYVTYHVDVGETPFFIGIDYDMSKIVISIRGTLSMKVCDAQHFQSLYNCRVYFVIRAI